MASAPQNSEPANSVHSVEAKGIQFSPSSALGGITLDQLGTLDQRKAEGTSLLATSHGARVSSPH